MRWAEYILPKDRLTAVALLALVVTNSMVLLSFFIFLNIMCSLSTAQVTVLFSNHGKSFHEHQEQAKVYSRDPIHRPKETPDYAF